MKQNIISLIIIAFGAICVAQLTIQITNQCECSQFSQNSCGTIQSDQTCYWNTTSQACLRKGCQQLYSQESCLQNFVECYWNGNLCQQFTSCSQLTYQDISCTQQNIQCGQFTSNSTNCLSLDDMPDCSFFNQDQCTPQQIGYQGTLCFLNSTQQCQTATSCSQLQTQSQCTQWKNTCQWNSTNTECVQLECNSFQTQSTCTNIILGLNPQSIMPCQFFNGTCQSIGSAKQLTSQDCSSKTLSTYYWIQANNNTGTCIPCNILNNYQPNNKCSCSSYLSQQCQSSSYCQWSNGECNPIECNQIPDQLSCIQNLGCSWLNNQCQTFNSCPTAFNPQQCIESSFNCLIFQYPTCSILSDNSCSKFYNSYYCQNQLGYCYWLGNQCQQVQQCDQITQQRQCYRFGYACTWQNGRCRQLTCNKIQYQNDCIYTIPQLYTNDVQPCIWQNGKCQNLNSVNSLTAAQCQSISFDTYKWTGQKCVKCIEFQQQIQNSLQLPNQCLCSQLFTQQQCQQSHYCYWSGNYCSPHLCSYITNQASCASNPFCFWIDQQCSTFISCNLLKGASQSECIVQSINCPASDGTNCQDKQQLQACSSYLKQNQCQYVLGSNGICFWQSNSCQVLSKCTQINTYTDCQYFKKQCYWGTTCQPASCSQFKTVENCQFYYTSINSYTPVPCYWNSTTGVCTQSTNYMTQLNINNCQTNTNQGARWSQTLNACLSCQAPQLPNPNQCSCTQLISQLNCLQSLQCQWNSQTNSCQQLPCTNLQQSLCIQNSQCMWIGSCQQFTQCSNLKATTSAECAAQSLYCPYFNSKQCQAVSISEFQHCKGLSQQNCNIVIPPYYYCSWNYQQNQCQIQAQTQCEYYSQYQCQTIPYCFYQNGCKLKLCSHYYTKESCTFSFNPQNWNYIQSCSWLNGICVPTDNLLSEQTCFTNTDQTARWSSNIKDGFCIPCNLPLQQVIVPKNQCLCSQLLTYEECDQTSCNWVGDSCTDLYCGRIRNQIDCIQNYQCYWIYDMYESSGGQCENLDYKDLLYQKDPCTKLRGNNSLECLSQSLLCPVSLNGVCQNRALLQTCQSMNSLQLCANSIGQEGYCTYENQQCQVLSSCFQLKNFSECSIFNKSCQFVASSGQCEQLQCSSYTNNEGDNCKYVFQNINKANIQICVWNATTKTCSSASYLIQQPFENCYSNTGGTYHWSSPQITSGSCVSCSLNRIKPKNTCSCTLLNQVECTLSKPVCKLNQNNECEKSQCYEILDSVNCSQQNECMWNKNQCVTFTKCTDLNGTTNLDCVAQSLQCQSIQNGICQSASSLNSCEKYSQTQCKLGRLGSEGFCYFNAAKNSCQVISSCDQVNNLQYCENLNPACKWSYYFLKCVPFQCQDYLYEEECKNVVVNLQDPQIELCVWQNYKCVPFVDTYYRFDNAICYIKSDHTYRWVKEDKLGVRCQQCLQAYLINIIAIVLLLNFI